MAVAVVITWVWMALEIGLRVRDRLRGNGSTAGDGRTRLTITLLIAASMIVAIVVAVVLPADSALRFPGSSLVWAVLGILLMVGGLVLRVWSIAVLGKSFRTTVEVDADQTVVNSGPYRWVRHPSYSGMLLLTIGYGIASDNWISLLVTIVLPAAALLRRIGLEEEVLVETLGQPYEEYRIGTKRLVPGVW
ncbi:methyltransferase family protein [Nocardia sp. NPDC020380]|uniref:methyltransferase family protein n=1 Tax=Nocardia sp. NPDC020380 TaxID=3364309 RepID=UPI0037A715D3